MLSASNISNYTELIIAREKSTSTLTGSIALLNNVVAGFLILPRQKVMVTVVFELSFPQQVWLDIHLSVKLGRNKKTSFD